MSKAVLIADGLADQGFDVRDPLTDNSHLLQVVNAWHAYCEIAISEKGAMNWEYRCFDGRIGPAQITRIVLRVLGAESVSCDTASLEQRPGVTLKGVVGRKLREHGMRVGMTVVDPDDFCELYAEICAINPDMPARGAVRVSDDGMILWECHLRDPAEKGDQGITPDEVTRTIADALALAGQFNC